MVSQKYKKGLLMKQVVDVLTTGESVLKEQKDIVRNHYRRRPAKLISRLGSHAYHGEKQNRQSHPSD